MTPRAEANVLVAQASSLWVLVLAFTQNPQAGSLCYLLTPCNLGLEPT